jgi:hypothetical protein
VSLGLLPFFFNFSKIIKIMRKNRGVFGLFDEVYFNLLIFSDKKFSIIIFYGIFFSTFAAC